MRILFLTTIDFNEQAGGVVYSQAICEALSTLGTVSIVALSQAQHLSSRKLRWLAAGVKALLTGVPPNVLFHSGWLRLSVQEQLRKAWDLVVLDHLESAWARPMNCAHVLYVSHNRESTLVDQKMPWAPALFRRALTAWVDRYEHRVVRAVRGVITISSEEAAWYRSLNTQVRVIPPVFKVAPHASAPANGENRHICFGFLGSAKWQPNAEAMRILLEKILPNTRRPMELLIAGSGWDASALQKTLDCCAPHSQILLRSLGYVSDISEFWSEIDVFLAPITAGAGVNVKVCEAMANGCPIIALPHALRGLGDLPLDGVRTASTPSDFAHELDTIEPATIRYSPPPALSPSYAARTIAGLLSDIQHETDRHCRLPPLE